MRTALLAGILVAGSAAAVDASTGAQPWTESYSPGVSQCLGSRCTSSPPHRGYVARAKVTAPYRHKARAAGQVTNLDHFAVYASVRATRRVVVEWEVVCAAPYNETVDSQGTFRLVGKGRRALRMPKGALDECAGSATAIGQGRVYVELDGVPTPNMPATNFG